MSSEADFTMKQQTNEADIVKRLVNATEEYNSNLRCVSDSQGRRRRVFIAAEDFPLFQTVNSGSSEQGM
jgi:hypothetical protein